MRNGVCVENINLDAETIFVARGETEFILGALKQKRSSQWKLKLKF